MKTMNAVIAVAVIFGAVAANADGFVCMNEEKTLKVAVYDHTRAKLGTRNAAKMVISNPRLKYGKQTIAAFDRSSGLLRSKYMAYTAKVDLRHKDSSRKGEYVGGTRLGSVDTFRLAVDFSYGYPVAHGDESYAQLTILTRSGDIKDIDMLCVRYLKSAKN